MATQLIITFTAREDRVAAFNEVLAQIKLNLPKASGCRGVRIFRSESNPLVFTLVETWASAAEHKKYVDGFVASGGWAQIARQLSCDPVSGYYSEI